MPLFHYRAVSSSGKRQRGVIDASNFTEAKEKLCARGTIITALKSHVQKNSLFGSSPLKLSKTHLVTITHQLSQLLSAGLPLYESLHALEEQYREEKFHPIILSLCDQIKGGGSLSHAMACYPNSFNSLYISMITAGEAIGALETTLAKLAELIDKQVKLKKQIITALIYPALLSAFSLLVVFLLMIFVIPSMESLFVDRNVNRFTSIVLSASRFFRHQWGLLFSLVTLSAIGGYFTFRPKKTRLWLQERALQLPLIGPLIIQTAIARFSRTLGTLLDGGVSLINALQISKKVMNNPILEETITYAEKRIIEGSQLSTQLYKSKWIPKLLPRMLAVGEEGGNLSVMLLQISTLYEEKLEQSLTRATTLLQPIILLIIGAVVGVIMLAVLIPLTDMSNFI